MLSGDCNIFVQFSKVQDLTFVLKQFGSDTAQSIFVQSIQQITVQSPIAEYTIVITGSLQYCTKQSTYTTDCSANFGKC